MLFAIGADTVTCAYTIRGMGCSCLAPHAEGAAGASRSCPSLRAAGVLQSAKTGTIAA